MTNISSALSFHGNVSSPEFKQDPENGSAPTAISGGAAVLEVVLDAGWRSKGYGIVEYYSDADGATPADPTAGTETVLLIPSLVDQGSDLFAATITDQGSWVSGVLNHASAAPQGFDWRWPIKTVRVTLAGIVGATHARLRVEALLT